MSVRLPGAHDAHLVPQIDPRPRLPALLHCAGSTRRPPNASPSTSSIASSILLSENSELGRPGRVPGTRELVILNTPYIVPDRVRGATIEIARVYHGARRWPERL